MLTIQVRGRTLLLIAGVLVGLWALTRLWEIFVVVATAFIFMAAFLPYVEWLVQRGIHRVAAVLLLLLAFLIVLGGILALIVPAVISEGKEVKESLPEYGRTVDEQADRFGLETDLEERASNIDWNRSFSGRQAVDYGQRVFFAFITLISIVVITCYLLIDAPRMATFLYRFVTPGYEPEVARFLENLRIVVGGYIRGQIITSAAIASYTAAFMLILGVPNAFAFGILAAFADILPLVGATLAIGPPVLVALDESPTAALILLIALLAYQQFEDRFLTPKVFGNTLNLPPIIVLVTVLIGGELFGLSGVLLALPAAAVGRVVLDTYLERRDRLVQMKPETTDIFAPDAEDTR